MLDPDWLCLEVEHRRRQLLAEVEQEHVASMAPADGDSRPFSLRRLLRAVRPAAIRTASQYSTEESFNAAR